MRDHLGTPGAAVLQLFPSPLRCSACPLSASPFPPAFLPACPRPTCCLLAAPDPVARAGSPAGSNLPGVRPDPPGTRHPAPTTKHALQPANPATTPSMQHAPSTPTKPLTLSHARRMPRQLHVPPPLPAARYRMQGRRRYACPRTPCMPQSPSQSLLVAPRVVAMLAAARRPPVAADLRCRAPLRAARLPGAPSMKIKLGHRPCRQAWCLCLHDASMGLAGRPEALRLARCGGAAPTDPHPPHARTRRRHAEASSVGGWLPATRSRAHAWTVATSNGCLGLPPWPGWLGLGLGS